MSLSRYKTCLPSFRPKNTKAIPKLSVMESLIFAFGICGSVHLLIHLLESLEAIDETDHGDLMKMYARNQFFADSIFHIKSQTHPFFH